MYARESDQNDSMTLEADVTDKLFGTLKDYAKFAYEQEIRREESIKSQAYSIQVVIALLMIVTVDVTVTIAEHVDLTAGRYPLIILGGVFVCLVGSLMCAVLSLGLWDTVFCSTISDQKKYLEKHIEDFKDDNSITDYIIQYYNELHKSKRSTIKNRTTCLNISRCLLESSLGLFIFCFWVLVTEIL